MRIRIFFNLLLIFTAFSLQSLADPAIPSHLANKNVKKESVTTSSAETSESQANPEAPQPECKAEIAELPEYDEEYFNSMDLAEFHGFAESTQTMHKEHLPPVFGIYEALKRFLCATEEEENKFLKGLRRDMYFGNFDNIQIPEGTYKCHKYGHNNTFNCRVSRKGLFSKLGGSQRYHGFFLPSVEGYNVMLGVTDFPSGKKAHERFKVYSKFRGSPPSRVLNGSHGSDALFVVGQGVSGDYYLFYGSHNFFRLIPQ